MWFNIVLSNHGTPPGTIFMEPQVAQLRQTLSLCGHQVTVSHDQVNLAAINLYFEYFADDALADLLITAKQRHGLRIGVIATELMTGGTIPYARHGIVFGEDVGQNKDLFIARRVANFARLVPHVDFVWCMLERTALAHSHLNPNVHVWPAGHTLAPPPETRLAPKNLDIVFFGAATPHRVDVLNRFAARGLAVSVVGRGFPVDWRPGFYLASMLDQAKIGLNITLEAYRPETDKIDPRFASCLRIKEMLDHELCIVSETIPLDNPYGAMMVSGPADGLADICADILAKGTWGQRGAQAATLFRDKMDARALCAPIIAKTLAIMGVS